MTHLRIEQNNGVIEEVSPSIITKLYEIAHAGLDVSSNLLGRLHCPVSYRAYITYLTTQYPDLYITVDDYAIPFEDLNMVTYLNSIGVGSNGMITEDQAAAATKVAEFNSNNTTVTKFNELRYFTNITQSKGGWTGTVSGNLSFYGWTSLLEVDISNFTSLGHVGASAYEDTFCNCSSLKTVIASDKLTKIGYNAFSGCTNLEDITGLSGSIGLGNYVFRNCSKLTSDNFANCSIGFEKSNNLLYWLGESAFRNCTALTTINLNETPTIPNYAFSGCSNLSSVTGLRATVDVYGWAFENCVSLSNIGNTIVTDLGNSAFNGCTSLTSISIALSANPGTGSWFNGCTSLSNVTCDWTNCPIVANYAFFGCSSLLTIDLTGVTEIKERAFGNCTMLTTITGNSDLIIIGKNAFENCNHLETISLNLSNCTSIGLSAFYYCSNFLGLLNFPSLTNLDSKAFWGCGASLINISDDITYYGESLFRQSGITSFIIPDTVTEVSAAVFKDCKSLQSVVVGSGLIKIGDSMFHGCTSLLSITIKEGVLKISGNAFRQTAITNIELPSTINEVTGNEIFNQCSSLNSITFKSAIPPTITQGTFVGSGNCPIYVPSASLNDYKTAQYWSNLASRIFAIPT